MQDYCDRLAISVFGIWGAHWFRIAVEGASNPSLVLGDDSCEVSVEDLSEFLKQPGAKETPDSWPELREKRGQWVYEEVMAGVSFPAIIGRLAQKIKEQRETGQIAWRRVTTKQGIKSIAKTYADEHNLPRPPKRPGGRPPG